MASETIKQDLTDREKAILLQASEELGKEGELEFDDFCAISEGDDNGAYVQAWVWVDFAGTELCKGGEGDIEPCHFADCPACAKKLEGKGEGAAPR